jgi:hypothetical protein
MLLIDTRRFSIAIIRTSGRNVSLSNDSSRLSDEVVEYSDMI